MHRTVLIFAAALIALMAGALFYAARMPVEQKPSEPATDAPLADADSAAPAAPVEFLEFELPGLDGNAIAFSSFSGRHRLLNFWATWCAPCRREIPLLKRFQAAQGEDGILVIGIAVDFPDEVAAYAESAEFNYPILIGQEDAMAVAESSGVPFAAMPFTMIVSREGRYLGAYLGEVHQSHLDDIEATLDALDSGELELEAAKAALARL